MTYTPKDFQYDIPPRIVGSESEYNLQHMTDELDFRPYVDGYYRENADDHGTQLWLSNGSRLYLDSGGLVEYATPEVTSAKELLAYERAGERTVTDIASGMGAELGLERKNRAYKRSGYSFPNSDYYRTAGHHENYLTVIPKLTGFVDKEVHPSHQALYAYLSTRGIWAGSGLVAENQFLLTQKQNSISFTSSSKVTIEGSKAAYLIHENERGFTQLEVRLGDGNMSDWAITNKYAFTSFVLRLIEHGEFPSHLLLPRGEADRILQQTARMEHVRTRHSMMHPAKHQRLIAQACLEFARQFEYVPPEELEAAHEIITVCHQIEEIDRSLSGASIISDRVDWAAKLALLHEKGIELPTHHDPVAISIDLQWEDVARNGIARIWYRKYQDPAVRPEQITLAQNVPPATRAMARTALLGSLGGHPHAIRWSYIEAKKLYKFPDPWSTLLPN